MEKYEANYDCDGDLSSEDVKYKSGKSILDYLEDADSGEIVINPFVRVF